MQERHLPRHGRRATWPSVVGRKREPRPGTRRDRMETVITLRLTRDVRKRAEVLAAADKRTVSAYLRLLLEQALEQAERERAGKTPER